MALAAFAAIVWQVIDFLREVANVRTQRSAVITQLTAWLGGFALVALAAHAKAGAGIVLPGVDLPLGKLDWTSIILVGLGVSSLASTGVDIKQAIDRFDTSAKPSLLKDAPAGVGTPQPGVVTGSAGSTAVVLAIIAFALLAFVGLAAIGNA